MPSPFPDEYKSIADSMGIALYQRFTAEEAALFLRCPVHDVKSMVKRQLINFINVTDSKFEFFGYQLLEYLLYSVSSNNVSTASTQTGSTDRILRTKEVQEMTGVSRTTLWRLENKGDFPRRVSLGVGSVGWYESDVKRWVTNRPQC